MTSNAIEKELLFEEEEYRGRIAAVQKELEAVGADAFLVYHTHSIFHLSASGTTRRARPEVRSYHRSRRP